MLRKIASIVLSSAIMFSTFGTNFVFGDVSQSTTEKIVAFPGAEGGGMYATGVRGAIADDEEMAVYHVTNLSDSGSGSFRDAVSSGNRIVVFDVSGYIDLKSNVTIGGKGKKNITILGQTAPGDGICFRGNNIKVAGENIILRYLRFRVGDKLADGSDTRAQDGLEIVDDTKNVIVDHCSVSWGTDENLSAYAVKDVTIQNSIIAEALNQSVHDKGEHSYAAIWGGVNLTVHHNLIATHKSRNPKIGTSETTAMTEGYKDSDTVVDIRNNVIYNWGDKAGYGAENGAQVNIINNWYRPGPSTPENKRARIFEYSGGNKYQKNWSGKVFAEGNYIDVEADDPAKATADIVNEENYQPELKTGVYPDSDSLTYENLKEPNLKYFNDYPITTSTAEEAYNYVLANAGARLPKMDAVDERIIDNVVNRTAPNGSKGSVGLVDSPADTVPTKDSDKYDDRGYPILSNEVRADNFDLDNDGIPDEWEDKLGLDKTNPNDSLNIGTGGYTWLEIYADVAFESIGNPEELAVKSVYYDETSGKYCIEYPSVVDFEKLEFYSNGKFIGEDKVGNGKAYIDFDNMPFGENYISAKLTNKDGTYLYGATKVVNFMPKDVYSGTDFDVLASGNSITAESDGKYYMQAEGNSTTSLSKKDLTDDFSFVVEIEKISNLANEIQTGVSIVSEGGKYIKVYKTYENNQIVLKADKNGTVSTVDIDPCKAKIIKVSKSDDDIVISSGKSSAELSEVLKASFKTDLLSGKLNVSAYTTSADGKTTISVFDKIKFISSEQITTPSIEITNIKNNQRIGFKENVEVKVVPDAKAKINEVALFMGDNLINSIAYEDGIVSEQTISIPVSFSSVMEGTLRAVCFDENLGMGEYKVSVAVSADITPWNVVNIGGEESDMASYVQGTNDYTYKIYALDGNISGTSDKYGYMYQKFNDDMRLYYRSRVQNSKNFGVMIKDSLDADGVSYFFGTEPNETDGYRYVLKARTEKGGAYTTIKTFTEMTGDRYYVIAEKEGNKVSFYLTNGNSNEPDNFYKTKELLGEIETTLGDEYYMGFAATKGTPDAGWIAIENIDKGNQQSYKWNMNYGLDWYWQMQESNILAPSWTTENIGGNDSGKMVIAPNSEYSERFLTHEYIIEQGVVENGFDVFITGEKPAIDFYLQTQSGSANKVGFNNDGTVTVGTEILENVNISKSEWYSVKIRAKVGESTASVVIYDSNGNVIGQKNDVEAVSFTGISPSYNRHATITQGFYIKPLDDSQGTYYLDNMYVSLNAKSSLENAIARAEALKESDYSAKTWAIVKTSFEKAKTVLEGDGYVEEDYLNAALTLDNAIDALEPMFGEVKGETKFWNFGDKQFTSLTNINQSNTVDGITLNFDNKASLTSGGKTFDDKTAFSYTLKSGGSGSSSSRCIKFTVPGKADIKVYAVSAKSSETRNLVITDGTNTKKYGLTGSANVAEFSYTGSEPKEIIVYGESGLNYFGVKYTPYITNDKRTKISEYNKTTGIVKIFNGTADLKKAVVGVVATDDNGKVIDIVKKEFDITVELEEVQEVNVGTIAENANLKVFLWDSFENMKPLCKSLVISK